MNRVIHLLILSLMLSFAVEAQQVRFKYTYGGTSYDYGRSAKQIFDKGYIAAGSTSSFGLGNMDILLIRTDSMGAQRWARNYGGTNVDHAYCVQQTQDTCFIIAGYTNSFGAGGYDFYLIKTDTSGNVKWAKTYGGSDWEFAYSVQQTSDGGYIIAGGTYTNTAGDEDVYLVKTNSTGDTLWTKKYGGAGQDEARSVKQTSDGGYILTGFSKTASDTLGNVYVIKTNSTGDTTWTRKYGGTKADFGNDVIESVAFSRYFVCGGTNSFGLPDLDFYLLVLQLNGDTIITHKIEPGSGGGDDVANGLTAGPGSKFAFIGSNYSASAGLNDAFFFQFDQNGYYTAATSYGTFQHDEGFSIQTTADKGYIICGYTDSTQTGFGQPNLFLVKTDSAGATVKKFSVGSHEIAAPERSFTRIYPNPMGRTATISIANPSRNHIDPEQVIIKAVDILGRELGTGIVIKQTLNLQEAFYVDIEQRGLEPGIYFISVVSSGELLGEGKLIITEKD